MPGKRIDITCGRLRQGFVQVVGRVLGRNTSLMSVGAEDLDDLKHFYEHAEHCNDCGEFLEGKRKAFRIVLESEE